MTRRHPQASAAKSPHQRTHHPSWSRRWHAPLPQASTISHVLRLLQTDARHWQRRPSTHRRVQPPAHTPDHSIRRPDSAIAARPARRSAAWDHDRSPPTGHRPDLPARQNTLGEADVCRSNPPMHRGTTESTPLASRHRRSTRHRGRTTVVERTPPIHHPARSAAPPAHHWATSLADHRPRSPDSHRRQYRNAAPHGVAARNRTRHRAEDLRPLRLNGPASGPAKGPRAATVGHGAA